MAMNFPLLSLTEATELCKNLFGPIIKSEDDIKHPKTQKIQSLYSAAMQKVYDLSENQLTQAPFQAMQELPNPEIYEDSLPPIVFALTMQRFMSSCGVSDFTFKDILQPKPKRTLLMISAILNYIKFKDVRMDVFEDAMAEVDAVQEQRLRLAMRNQDLKGYIEAHQSTRMQQEEDIQQTLSETSELQKAVNELNRHQAEELSHIQEIKAQIEENKSKLANIKVNIASVKEDFEKAKSQLVTSPDRLKGEITRAHNMELASREDKEEKSKKIVDLIAQKTNRERFLEKAENSLQIVTDIQAEMNKYKQMVTVLETNSDVYTSQMHNLNNLNAKLQNVKHALQSKHERFSRQNRQHEKKEMSINDEISFSTREEAMAEEALKSISKQSRNIIERKNELKAKLESSEETHLEEMDNIHKKYRQLISQVEEYNKTLVAGFELMNQKNATLSTEE